jgi:hypothetical protein
VFRDIETIGAGSDFVEVIAEGLRSCRAFPVVLGREWLTAVDATGRHRLDDPEDIVRLEVATALESGLLVVPVLVEGPGCQPRASCPKRYNRWPVATRWRSATRGGSTTSIAWWRS